MRIAWDDQINAGKEDISRQRESHQPRESLFSLMPLKTNDEEEGCRNFDGAKSLRTLSILRKRHLPDTDNDTRFSKRKKLRQKIRADKEDSARRRESLRSHTAVKNNDDIGEGYRAPRIQQTEKVAEFVEKSRRKIRADKEDIARRRESLRSYTALKDSDGEDCRVSDCAQGEKEAREDGGQELQITVYESGEQSFTELDVRSYPEEAAKLLTGLQELIRRLKEIDAIFQKCRELSDIVESTEPSQGELEGENEEDVVIKMAPPYCEILDVVMGDAQNDGWNRNSVVGFVGNHKFDHEVIEINSDSDDGGELIDFNFHASSHLGQCSFLKMRSLKVVTTGEEDDSHLHEEKVSEREIVMVSSDDEGEADAVVVISSDDEEEGANGKKIVSMDHGVSQSHSEEHPDGNQLALEIVDTATSSDVEVVPMESIVCKPPACMQKCALNQSHSEEHPDGNQLALEIVDSATSSDVEAVPMEPIVCKPPACMQKCGLNQPHSEEHPDGNQLALQIVDNTTSSNMEVVPMEPIVCKPLACMQENGPWSTPIRKDRKRWRRKNLGWTHIKRKYLVYKRLGEARLGTMNTNLESLLRNGRQKEESGFPDDIPDDEDAPYEAYRRSSQMAKELEPDPDEEELEDLFQEMALAFDKGWEKKETLDNQIVPCNNGGCSHDYALEDDVGWVCEKCGLVGQDIQSIFVQDSTRPKEKTAIVPVNEESLDPESQDHQGLSLAQGALKRVALTLHPYYEEHLHPHQKEGITFLTRNLLGDAQTRLPPGGCILAHAPGTGKSCLTVSFVQSFLTAYPNGRPLIVAPKIMLKPWQNEFEQWNVEEIPVYNLNETLTKGKRKAACRERDGLANVITSTPYYREGLEGRRLRLIKKWLETRSVLLVSYNMFAGLVLAGLNDDNTGSVKRQLCEALLDGPELLILDEGHFPRTKRTKISQALMRVRTNRKILLSGTLFQNNFKELFNLMKLARHNFMSLCPEFATRLKEMNRKIKPSLDEEDTHFAGRTHNELNPAGREHEEQMFMDDIGSTLEEFVEGVENFEEINVALRKLRALTGPIVHWYTGQILESLPGLCEFVVYLNLTAHQHKLLSRLKCKSSFEEKTRIAEVCIHPELLKNEENLELAPTAGHKNAYNAQHDPSEGVKTAFVFNLLRLCHISGERLLIFCQTLSPLTLIESMLTKILGWSKEKEILRLDGKMQSDERQSMIEKFNDRSSHACVMLASITACKEGISLVGASRVVILDVLYNPSVVRQAVSRAFRIGQKKRVYVYRLVAADTKEERIFQAAVQKDWLSRVLMDQSLRMSGVGRYRAEKILQMDAAPEDRILQKMLHTDGGNRIDRVCRYQSEFSK